MVVSILLLHEGPCTALILVYGTLLYRAKDSLLNSRTVQASGNARALQLELESSLRNPKPEAETLNPKP